ncbi:hypothetical protein BMS3Abin17_00744 [archaeon BMS3Abin17]|nr:hypothetical protein BMS3Abin17_00744 [archaeon BMS3Abin17]HDZ60883.1 hypothetical protein [Candidatus Pacearchaeota archaeon]
MKRGFEKKKVVGQLSILFLAMFLFSLHFFQADESQTELTVGAYNIPPILLELIPNQTWAKNTNLTEIFDLDDYFIDNETLTYNYSQTENITILINETTNKVSFYPDINFIGINEVIFSAFDGSANSSSNTVTLNVTEDTHSPTWNNVVKDKSSIAQNTVVTFSADWQDDISLDNYIFAIKQEGGWVNQSLTALTGTQNTSSYAIQISAPSGTTVHWRFYAFDTSWNMNVTDIENFTVIAVTPTTYQDEEEEEEYEEEGAVTTEKKEKTQSFSIKPEDSFMLDIKQGETSTITIKIINTGTLNSSFNLKIEGLEEFESVLSDDSFELGVGEQKTITAEFKSDKRLRPDVYYGMIKVKTSTIKKEVLIAIVVNAFEVSFDLNLKVADESKSVRPNSVVKANITLKNLKEIEEREVVLYYSITNFKGDIIDSSQEIFSFSADSISLDRNLTLPSAIKRGDYIFFARVISEQQTVISSDVFEVGEEFNVGGFIKSNFFLLLIISSTLIATILMFHYQRNRKRLRLLSLYLMITEMKKLIKENKLDDAIAVYIRLKSAYGEPVSNIDLKSKEELKKQMLNLSKKVNLTILEKTLNKQDQNLEKSGVPKQDDKTQTKPQPVAKTPPVKKESKPQQIPQKKDKLQIKTPQTKIKKEIESQSKPLPKNKLSAKPQPATERPQIKKEATTKLPPRQKDKTSEKPMIKRETNSKKDLIKKDSPEKDKNESV